MSIRLIHIAPELPPTVGGVADYTAILTRRLVEVSDGTVGPVLVHAGNQETDAIEVDFPVVDLSGQCSATALAEAVDRLAGEAAGRAVVLLEYSGYGYAKRGAPLWLSRGLRRVCGRDGVPLITIFHELYATGPPWTSAFWLSFPQAWIVRRLARKSQLVLSNRVASAKWLQQNVRSSCPVQVHPTFSNVGEPSTVTDFEDRESYAVVFGNRAMKSRLYSELHKFQVSELRSVGVSRLVEIGSSTSMPDTIHGLPIERQGIQPVRAVSATLREAKGGLLHYPIDYLTKSGIWASYAAHGIPPLVLSEPKSTEEINEGKHYIRFKGNDSKSELSSKRLRSVGKRAWEWYRGNATSAILANRLERFFQGHGEYWETGKWK